MVRCKRVVETEFHNREISPDYGGPEYETLGTFGSYCGVKDIKAIALANQTCAQYGIDTISTGATVAFAMECFEKGILNLNDTQGIDLHFGSAEGLISVVDKIVTREGIGDLLADGSYRASKTLARKQKNSPSHRKDRNFLPICHW